MHTSECLECRRKNERETSARTENDDDDECERENDGGELTQRVDAADVNWSNAKVNKYESRHESNESQNNFKFCDISCSCEIKFQSVLHRRGSEM